jgi:hypothetical protein
MKLLLEKLPKRYAYHERQEQKTIKHIRSGAHGFIRKTTDGVLNYLTMKQFRKLVESEKCEIPADEFGGCGCFTDYEEE